MSNVKELNYKDLKNEVVISESFFKSLEDKDLPQSIIGQIRGSKALSFGLKIKSYGYNIFVSGLAGTGKTTFSEKFARSQAEKEAIPPDLCYVYNFIDPKTPNKLIVEAGIGKSLKADMEELIENLQDELPRAFSEKDFEVKKTDIVKIYQNKRDDIIKDMTEEAREQNFGVKTTNSGIYFMPIVNGEAISEEEYENLPQEDKDNISVHSEVIQSKAQQVMRAIKEFEKQTRREVEDLEYSIGLFTVSKQITPIIDKYAPYDNVTSYLLAVKEDILENLSDFLEEESEEEESLQTLLPWMSKKNDDDDFSKYKVNVLTDNSSLKGAPVIVDYNPTYGSLVGEIEYDNEYGNLTTDFMKIKPGLLHKANGGYLILQAHDVLLNYHSWESIRRALITKEVVIEPLKEFTSSYPVSGIKPEPMPLDVKVILVGSFEYYEILFDYDDVFRKLFKITADFDYEMEFNNENVKDIINFVTKTVKEEKLLNFDNKAVSKVVEYCCRLAESQKRLSTEFLKVFEVLIEANAWALEDNKDLVVDFYVEKAIAERENRFKQYEDKLSQLMDDGVIMIDTFGEKIGQINGLVVFDMQEYSFGKPSKITATSYIGKAGIINIEHEAEMSGSIHDKGMEVLTGYLGQTYAQDFPLSLSARVCFEQSYAGVDGDSASSTELYAILSSIGQIPLRQDLAVTGSINQKGEIQPIGGVTYKVEGFFDLCKKRGLTGSQGVIIPVQNINDLMLKDEVVNAVKEGYFHIYPITHVDEGMELLTGLNIGDKNEQGKYQSESIHGKVVKRLKAFYKKSLDA